MDDRPNFKDLIQNDVKNVFLNTCEFAGIVQVNGKPMNVLTDELEMLERKGNVLVHDDGIYKKEILFYVSAEEFGNLPRIGGNLRFNGKDYIVKDATDEEGMYAVTITANKSGR